MRIARACEARYTALPSGKPCQLELNRLAQEDIVQRIVSWAVGAVVCLFVLDVTLLWPSEPGRAATAPLPPWLTYHNGLTKSGVDPTTGPFASVVPGWVSPTLDEQIYAEPLLYGTNVIVATMNNTVYALDAGSGAITWQIHLGAPMRVDDLPCSGIATVGILSTPTIDPATDTLYVVPYIQPGIYSLVALNASTGAFLWWRPLNPPGLDQVLHLQRGAVTLSGGTLYIPFGGRDCGTYHGWVVGAPTNASGPLITFQTPTSTGGGIWSPGGPAVDSATGNLFVSTGNGGVTDSYDYSSSTIQLSPTLGLLSSFAPVDWTTLSDLDLDLGSVSPVLLGNGLVFVIGKQGVGYVLNQSNLGGIGGQLFSAQVCQPDTRGAIGASAYFAPYIFLPCQEGLVVVRVNGSTFNVAWRGPRLTLGAPILSGGAVWAMLKNGLLYAVDANSGLVRFVSSPGMPTSSFPSIAAGNGQIFVAAGTNVANFVMSPNLPATVGGGGFELAAVAGGSLVTSWQPGTAHNGYVLYRSSSTPVNVTANATSYTDLPPIGSPACYAIVPWNDVGAAGIPDVHCAYLGNRAGAGAAPTFA